MIPKNKENILKILRYLNNNQLNKYILYIYKGFIIIII